MLRQLRIKFVCITMAISTVMLCVIMGLVLHFTSTDLEKQSVQMLRSAASAPLMHDKPDSSPGRLLDPCITVRTDRKGSIISVEGQGLISDETMLDDIVRAALAADMETGVIEQAGMRFLRHPDPAGFSIAFADISAERSMLRRLALNCLMIGAAAFAALAGASMLLAGWAVRPVEQAWRQQRTFVADASHELKTPLTVITTNAELLHSGAHDDDTERFSQSILTMARQMRGLTEGLLELARMDSASLRTAFECIDLSSLCSSAALPFDAVFFERGLGFSSDISEGISVMGSGEHLRRLIEILLDNACKYSLEHTDVSLTLSRSGRTHCLLTVCNRTAPIDAHELKHIFERFYRIDRSRGEKKGYGLGLSIAKSIVDDHRGEIRARCDNGKMIMTVRLPMIG